MRGAEFAILLAILVIVWQTTVAHRELADHQPVDSYPCVQAEGNRTVLDGCRSGHVDKFVAR